MAHILRCLLFLEAKNDVWLMASRIPGVENRAADNFPVFHSPATGPLCFGSGPGGTDHRHTVDLQRLEGLARDLVNDSLGPSTQRVYSTGQRRYLNFCGVHELNPFPLSEDQLCMFVAHLMDEGLQQSSIKGYLSAICRMQIVKGMGDPFASSLPLLRVHPMRN